MAPKKGASKQKAPAYQSSTVPDSDYIVFGDDKKKKKGKAAPSEEPPAAPKPTARQVVGGASWTGKLPVNLLSEFCQRQKWNKPDYSMRQLPGRDNHDQLYRSEVTLSKTDPKTKKVTKIPAFKLPQSDVHLADQPSALEARHFAATYALFRVQSMKSLHMTLPPAYRDLWKGDFTRLKKDDQQADRGWKYDEDPFAAETKRQEILKSMEQREEEIAKQKTQKATASGGTSKEGGRSKIWERAPQIDMGQQIRMDIEQIIRRRAVWNTQEHVIVPQLRQQIVTETTRLGFRRSHVEEALEFCADAEEVLEWLLVHVPEDDLPKWTIPDNYNAGVTLGHGDLAKERKIKSLAAAGYAQDLCIQALRIAGGDETNAAFALQQTISPVNDDHGTIETDSTSAWDDEMQILEATFGENFSSAERSCSIKMSTSTDVPFNVTLRCPYKGYPRTTVPAIAIEAVDLPAYIRLDAAKHAVSYARSELLGEAMVYSICEWLERTLPDMINKPGRLSELQTMPRLDSADDTASNETGKSRNRHSQQGRLPARQRYDQRTGASILDAWKTRQGTAEQQKMMKSRQSLPAWAKKSKILETISQHQVTIVSGETGSGKSTQVVQFVLDESISQLRGPQVNILCTQPRRVAALSLADRVSNERCDQVGNEVGYVIRGESRVSDQTKITFMTTGVLLRRLQSHKSIDQALSGISHIFIDEVHERSLDTDFLLALLKECIHAQPLLKIVLMSATLDEEIFSRYFGGRDKVGSAHIEGRTFPVRDLFLEDAIRIANPNSSNEDLGKTIQNLGFGINYDLIRDLVRFLDQDLGHQPGSILIFLPGTMEIDRCLRVISELPKVLGLPLHAALQPAEQRKVFPSAPLGRRKVVAATNVAETSITIEDVVAVIDTGRVKETNYDAMNNIVRLEEVWTSQSSSKQRRGRAGRVREGACYKLYTKTTESKMLAKTPPEIQRVPLEQLCLSVKATGMDRDIATFLSHTLTPPNSGAVSNAVQNLHTIGALDRNQLTPLGSYLAMIPADLRCAKLLIYGTVFDCLEPCLTVSSILTVKSPFVSPRDKREEANEARNSFSSMHGDLLLDLTAYNEWASLSQQLRPREMQDWCSSRFLSHQTLRDISSTRRQLLDSLKDAGLVPFGYKTKDLAEGPVSDTHQAMLLRALIAAALQPQLAVISYPSKKYISSISGAKELDPEAKTIKFFIPDESVESGGTDSNSASNSATPVASRPGTPRPKVRPANADVAGSNLAPNDSSMKQKRDIPPLSRVFIHPSSALFSSQTFSHHATHLSYFTKMMTTKPFIRDLTPLNIYSILFFGGKLDLDTSGHGIIVGGAWRVRGWARIGVLVSRLRVLFDEELRRCVEGDTEDRKGNHSRILLGALKDSEIVSVVRRLIVLNGQDQ